jgi:hypothetical protein
MLRVPLNSNPNGATGSFMEAADIADAANEYQSFDRAPELKRIG